MNLKTWIPLVLAVVLGLLAMKLAKDMIDQRRATPGQARTELEEVVVARRNVPAGAALSAADLAIGTMGGDVEPESIFRSINAVEGRVLTTALAKGQPVVETLLAPKGTGSGLQAVVPRGMRAITLEINEFSGLAGFLVPGCRVDVVSTLSGEGNELISRTIVQNVQVTALGRREQSKEGSLEQTEPIKSVTLLVKPKEAEAIELAAATGRPRLVLRSSGDKDSVRSDGISVAELRGRGSGADPFATNFPRVIASLPPLTPPTTRPVEPDPPVTPVMYPPLEMSVQTRTVKVIRGGNESFVTMELESEAGQKLMTDAK